MTSKADAEGSSGEVTFGEADVRRALRLLAEALTPDDGRAAKVQRLMDGLCTLTASDGWLWVRSRVSAEGGSPVNIDFLYGGQIDDHALASWAGRSLEVHGEPPEHAEMRRRLLLGQPFTVSRTDCVDDVTWRAKPNADTLDELGFDEVLYSWVPLAEAGGSYLLSGCVLLRRPGRGAFGGGEARLAHLVFGEAQPLHTHGLHAELADELAALSPRTRQVLALIVDGLSNKQVAQRLNLSPYTVGDHLKAIHRHFGVSSRAELLRHLTRS